MPVEKPSFRDNLEQILAFTEGKQMLCVKQVRQFTGLDYQTVKKLFPFKDNYISAATLARHMS